MTPDPQRHILLTGFEPFGGHPSNPSEEIAKAVDGRVVGGLVGVPVIAVPTSVSVFWTRLVTPSVTSWSSASTSFVRRLMITPARLRS